MAPKRPETMAGMVIAKCVTKQAAECIVHFLGLVWCTHPIVLLMKSSLRVIRLYKFRCDLCVHWQINMQHLREKIQFPCFQFHKVVQEH